MIDLIEFFGNHTFRMVFLGTTIIGLVSGALGSFAYLRKQSLISDVAAHSAALAKTPSGPSRAVRIYQAAHNQHMNE